MYIFNQCKDLLCAMLCSPSLKRLELPGFCRGISLWLHEGWSQLTKSVGHEKLHHCCNVWFGYGQLFFCLKKGLVAAWKCFAAIQQNPWFSSSLWYKCQLLLHSDRLDGWCEAEYIDALPGFKRKHHDIKVIDGELRFKLGSFKPDRRLGFFGNCWFGGWWNSSDHFWKLHLSGRLGRYHKTSLYHGIDSWD